MDRAVLLKKLKNKFLTSKTDKYKKYYKKAYSTFTFLRDIADPKMLKPIDGKLREYQLELVEYAGKWCKKFQDLGMSYFLISGNLLGAVRHKGFIPWDDDFDIGMMREDYNNLIEYLRKNYEEINLDDVAHSKFNQYEVIDTHLKKHPDSVSFAVFPIAIKIFYGSNLESVKLIEIFPYDYYNDDFTEEEILKYITHIRQIKNKLDNYKQLKDFYSKERLENKNIVEKSDKIYFGIDNYDFLFLKFFEWYTPKDIFPLRHMSFEGFDFCVPNNFEKFLRLNYGKNYMELPNKILIGDHVTYRTQDFSLKLKCSWEKKVLLKRLERKFSSKCKKYKQLYKDYKPSADLMLKIVDLCSVKPCKDKFLRNEQLKCVEFGKKITDFFNKNNLKYFITSGTLIGAVRHKGFVPWDDDFDVGMMRKDYERLKDILKSNFKEIDISEISISKHNKDSVIDKALKNSNGEIMYFIGPKYIQIYQGRGLANCTLIDVFPHEYYREDYTLEEHKRYMSGIKNKIAEIDSFKNIIEYLDNEIKTNPNVVEKSSKIYYGVDSLGSYIVNPTDFYYQDKIFPLRKVKFEDSEFWAPIDADAYIKVQYPDYWSFPKNFSIAPFLKIKLKY